MKTIDKILHLDNTFINTENQLIIDRELQSFQEFSNQRNYLIKKLEEDFLSDNFSEEDKKNMLKQLKESNDNIKLKFDSIKAKIKQNNLKTHQFKNLYQFRPTVQGSFFIDKTV